jgi:hypothetical protein
MYIIGGSYYNPNPNRNIYEDTQCIICHQEYTEDEAVSLLSSCNHFFHRECFHNFVRSGENIINCPMCRVQYGPRNIKQGYFKITTYDGRRYFELSRFRSYEQRQRQSSSTEPVTSQQASSRSTVTRDSTEGVNIDLIHEVPQREFVQDLGRTVQVGRVDSDRRHTSSVSPSPQSASSSSIALVTSQPASSSSTGTQDPAEDERVIFFLRRIDNLRGMPREEFLRQLDIIIQEGKAYIDSLYPSSVTPSPQPASSRSIPLVTSQQASSRSNPLVTSQQASSRSTEAQDPNTFDYELPRPALDKAFARMVMSWIDVGSSSTGIFMKLDNFFIRLIDKIDNRRSRGEIGMPEYPRRTTQPNSEPLVDPDSFNYRLTDEAYQQAFRNMIKSWAANEIPIEEFLEKWDRFITKRQGVTDPYVSHLRLNLAAGSRRPTSSKQQSISDTSQSTLFNTKIDEIKQKFESSIKPELKEYLMYHYKPIVLDSSNDHKLNDCHKTIINSKFNEGIVNLYTLFELLFMLNYIRELCSANDKTQPKDPPDVKINFTSFIDKLTATTDILPFILDSIRSGLIKKYELDKFHKIVKETIMFIVDKYNIHKFVSMK